MQSKTRRRVMAAVLSGCMLATNVPLETFAAEVSEVRKVNAEFSNALLNHEALLTTSSVVNEQADVKTSDYIPKQGYVLNELSNETETVTGGAIDLAMEMIPESIELTGVSSTSTPSVIRKALKEQLDEQLKDTAFVQDGGSISVSGDQNSFSVKLTLGEDTKTKTVTATFAIEGYDADIYEPATGLVMAPSVVSENDGKTVSELVSRTRRPSSIIRTVSENMTVTDANEEISIAEYVNRVNKKALVGFRIDSMTVANAFAAYAKENNLVDVMVISSDPEVLLAACNRMAGLHGMLDCGAYADATDVDIFDLISKTNEANARILVLPQELATEENIAYIQARAISTWVRTDKAQVTDIILNGADGILVDDSENAYDVIESFEKDTSVLTRNTVITAHRGFHETAPENSERAAKLAVEAGADTIECDIYLTKDGEVVVNHDDTTGRLMNKDLDVSESTLEELQALTFNENAQEGDKLPTLKELFIAADEADPDDDVVHVIEIKTKDTAVIEPMVKVIKEMNMEKRVVFISFYDYQLELVRKAMPNVAVGELNSVVSKTDDASTALKKLCYRMDEYGYFYNCSYGAQNTDILKAARFRGIYVHPWTVNAQDTFEEEYINNYHGITTNRTDYATNYLSEVTTGKDTYTVYAKENGVKIDAKAYTRAGDELEDATITMKQVSGTAITWDAATKTCTAQKAGEAQVIFGTTYKLTAIDKTYTVYSAPVTIKVENVVPSETMSVVNKLQKVSEVSHPTGWVWNTADAAKELIAGGSVEATAEYTGADKADYTTTTQKVTITKETCESGKILYTGEGEHAPDCGEQGLGHKECIYCGKVMETDIVVGTSGKHTWDEGVVTKEATATEKGEKTYTCTNCNKTKTEEIEALGAPEKNTVLTDNKSKAQYKVTVSGSKNGTVEYVKATNKTAKTVTIPEIITVDGITYKVNSIAQGAFKNNKKITKVTISSNVAKIGKQAFYGCKNLKTITIKTTKLTTGKVGSNAFKGIQKKATIKVPKAKLDAYKKMLAKKGIGDDVKVKGA